MVYIVNIGLFLICRFFILLLHISLLTVRDTIFVWNISALFFQMSYLDYHLSLELTSVFSAMFDKFGAPL